jgi:hypothetical protein
MPAGSEARPASSASTSTLNIHLLMPRGETSALYPLSSSLRAPLARDARLPPSTCCQQAGTLHFLFPPPCRFALAAGSEARGSWMHILPSIWCDAAETSPFVPSPSSRLLRLGDWDARPDGRARDVNALRLLRYTNAAHSKRGRLSFLHPHSSHSPLVEARNGNASCTSTSAVDGPGVQAPRPQRCADHRLSTPGETCAESARELSVW